MTFLDHVPSGRTMRTVALVALSAAGLLSCTMVTTPSPQEVRATKPGVTYAYRTDVELVEATRKAEDYCRQYDSWPRISTINPNISGGKDAVFLCDRPRTAAYEPSRPIKPSVSYAYRDDRDLVEATQSAERYCQRFNARPRSANVVSSGDGSRTVHFECE